MRRWVRVNGKPTLRGNHVLLALSFGVAVKGTQGKYEHGSRPPTWTDNDPVSTSDGVMSGVVSTNDRNRRIKTRQVQVNEKKELSQHVAR